MKIGFIDHHLNNYHSDTFHRLLTGPVGAGRVEIVGAYELERQAGEDWCEKHGVKRMESPEAVVQASDAVIVLAPNDVNFHLQLARPALESGKPTYIDKNLSSTVEDAREIIRLAEQHKTPLMSASSLRFSVELEEMVGKIEGEIEAVFSRGFGKFRGYSVHSIAPALRLVQKPLKRVIDTGIGKVRLLTLDYGTQRTSIEVRESENQYEATPWQVGAFVGDKYYVATITKFDDFYANLMREVLKFFTTGSSPLSAQEMLQEVQVECAADESFAKGGQWVTV